MGLAARLHAGDLGSAPRMPAGRSQDAELQMLAERAFSPPAQTSAAQPRQHSRQASAAPSEPEDEAELLSQALALSLSLDSCQLTELTQPEPAVTDAQHSAAASPPAGGDAPQGHARAEAAEPSTAAVSAAEATTPSPDVGHLRAEGGSAGPAHADSTAAEGTGPQRPVVQQSAADSAEHAASASDPWVLLPNSGMHAAVPADVPAADPVKATAEADAMPSSVSTDQHTPAQSGQPHASLSASENPSEPSPTQPPAASERSAEPAQMPHTAQAEHTGSESHSTAAAAPVMPGTPSVPLDGTQSTAQPSTTHPSTAQSPAGEEQPAGDRGARETAGSRASTGDVPQTPASAKAAAGRRSEQRAADLALAEVLRDFLDCSQGQLTAHGLCCLQQVSGVLVKAISCLAPAAEFDLIQLCLLVCLSELLACRD